MRERERHLLDEEDGVEEDDGEEDGGEEDDGGVAFSNEKDDIKVKLTE